MENQREDRRTAKAEDFATPDISTADWKEVILPGALASQGLPDSGVTWLRRTVHVPPHLAHQPPFATFIGNPRDFVEVYWNGAKVGLVSPTDSTSINTTEAPSSALRFDVPISLVRKGDNLLALRVFSPAGNAGIIAPYFCAVWTLPFAGKWLAKAEYEMTPLPATALETYPSRPLFPPVPRYRPAAIYQAMIAPLVPYRLRGILWYQGETNVPRGYQYRTALRLLIEDWRRQWGEELPFYLCQLANYGIKSVVPEENPYADIRESQAAVLSLPKTGMAVLIDLGEQDDIHFRNKKDVGERLARIALNRTYGEVDLSDRGPVLEKAVREESKIRLQFISPDGLVAHPLPDSYRPLSTSTETLPLIRNSPGSELEGFAVCGEDRKWEWAQAKIEGNSIWIWSDKVPEPIAIRYGWTNNPTCNLYSGAGLPASPFRTDDLPTVTRDVRY